MNIQVCSPWMERTILLAAKKTGFLVFALIFFHDFPVYAQVSAHDSMTRARVITSTSPTDTIEAYDYFMGSDSLRYRPLGSDSRAEVMALPISEVGSVYERRGWRRKTKQGVLIGTGAGALLWAIAVATEDDTGSDKDWAKISGLVMVPVGAVIGAGIGAHKRTEVWVRVFPMGK